MDVSWHCQQCFDTRHCFRFRLCEVIEKSSIQHSACLTLKLSSFAMINYRQITVTSAAGEMCSLWNFKIILGARSSNWIPTHNADYIISPNFLLNHWMVKIVEKLNSLIQLTNILVYFQSIQLKQFLHVELLL